MNHFHQDDIEGAAESGKPLMSASTTTTTLTNNTGDSYKSASSNINDRETHQVNNHNSIKLKDLKELDKLHLFL